MVLFVHSEVDSTQFIMHPGNLSNLTMFFFSSFSKVPMYACKNQLMVGMVVILENSQYSMA